jgi:SAM-dependent methyltransferase
MGISTGAIKLLLEEAVVRPFSNKVLTLGKQYIYTNANLLQKIASEANFKLVPTQYQINTDDGEYFTNRQFITDESFFKAIGFSSISRLDYSDYEGADMIQDLNHNTVTEDVNKQFDMIFDGGTFEHVFNINNAFACIHKLLKVGGRIIHHSPSSNRIDHGFYMFSPTLFWDYYTANNYNIIKFYICSSSDYYSSSMTCYEYIPGCLDNVSMGFLDNKKYIIWCIVEKLASSTCNVIPQQGLCVATWNKNQNENIQTNLSVSDKVKSFLRRNTSPKLFASLEDWYLHHIYYKFRKRRGITLRAKLKT